MMMFNFTIYDLEGKHKAQGHKDAGTQERRDATLQSALTLLCFGKYLQRNEIG